MLDRAPRVARIVAGAGWLVGVAVLLRIASGGSGAPRSVVFALTDLGPFLGLSLVAAIAAGIACLVALARGRSLGWSVAAAGVVAALGIALQVAGHRSGGVLTAAASTAGIGTAVAWWAARLPRTGPGMPRPATRSPTDPPV